MKIVIIVIFLSSFDRFRNLHAYRSGLASSLQKQPLTLHLELRSSIKNIRKRKFIWYLVMNSFALTLVSSWSSRKGSKRENTNTGIMLVNRDKSFIFYLQSPTSSCKSSIQMFFYLLPILWFFQTSFRVCLYRFVTKNWRKKGMCDDGVACGRN